MPKVSVLARDSIVVFIAPGQSEERIAVSYLTELFPPRVVRLPSGLYREPEPAEALANPRFRWLPKDDAARDAERQAIQEDIRQQQSAKPDTFELP